MSSVFARPQHQALRWLWALMGGLSLLVLLSACLGPTPCGTAAVPTPPPFLAAANGIFYLGQYLDQDPGVQRALRASDGAPLWTAPQARFEGAADGDVFFLKVPQPGAALLEARRDQDQSLLWHYAPHGLTALAVDQGVVYLAATDSVSALRASDGAQLWQQTLQSTPLLLKAAAGSVYLFGPESASALRERDGAPLWQTNTTWSPTSTLAVDAGTVYLGSAQQVQALRASDGSSLWQASIDQGSIDSTGKLVLAASGGMAYLGTSTGLKALRASDGSLVWQVPLADGGVASVLPLGEHVIYFGLDQQLYAVRASTGSRLWKSGLQMPSSGYDVALAATNGIIGVGREDSVREGSCGPEVFSPAVASVSASDGSVLWSSPSTHP